MAKPFSIASLAALVALAGVATRVVAQVQLVPYGSPGFRYEIVTGGFPPGVEQPGFDDSGFGMGAAPFSSGGGCSGPIYTPSTPWPSGTGLIARLHFTLASAALGATLHFGIDNNVTIYINGQQLASETHSGCASLDDYDVAVPDGLLGEGPNLIVALAEDLGGATAFDVSLLATGNADGGTLCSEAEEGSRVNLTAPPGRTITSIDFASYGTPTGSCGAFVQSDCNAATSRAVVEAACLGQNGCSVSADNTTFGDPCVGTLKRMCVQARYGSLATPAHRSTWGQLKTRYH